MAKQHWAVYAKLKREWKAKVHEALPKKCVMFEDKVIVTVTYYFPNKRKHDYDNYAGSAKLLLDGLSEKVIEDDSAQFIEELRIRFDYDKENPRTEINIRKVRK